MEERKLSPGLLVPNSKWLWQPPQLFERAELMLPSLDLREELQPEHTAQQQLMGEVLTPRQQPAQQGQGHAVTEGHVSACHWWLECCLWTEKGDGGLGGRGGERGQRERK